jgi:hypothetical protein
VSRTQFDYSYSFESPEAAEQARVMVRYLGGAADLHIELGPLSSEARQAVARFKIFMMRYANVSTYDDDDDDDDDLPFEPDAELRSKRGGAVWLEGISAAAGRLEFRFYLHDDLPGGGDARAHLEEVMKALGGK